MNPENQVLQLAEIQGEQMKFVRTDDKLQDLMYAISGIKVTYQEDRISEINVRQTQTGKLRVRVKRESIEYREFDPQKDI